MVRYHNMLLQASKTLLHMRPCRRGDKGSKVVISGFSQHEEYPR